MDMNQIKTNINVSNKNLDVLNKNSSFDVNSSSVENYKILDSVVSSSNNFDQNTGADSSQAVLNFFYGNYNNDKLITQSPKVGMDINDLLESKSSSNVSSSNISSGNSNFNIDDISTNNSNGINLVTNSTPIKMSVDSLLGVNNSVVDKISDTDSIQQDSKSSVDMDKFLGLK